MYQEPTEKERFTILLEDLHSDIKLLVEGQGSLREDNKSIHQKIDKNTEQFNFLQIDVNFLKKDVALIKEKLINFHKDVETTHSAMFSIFKDHENQLKRLKSA